MKIHALLHLSKATEYTPRVNRNVNSVLWVIMTYQCWYISCSPCTTLMQDVDSGGGCVCVAAGRVGIESMRTLYFPFNFPLKNCFRRVKSIRKNTCIDHKHQCSEHFIHFMKFNLYNPYNNFMRKI